MSKTIKKLSRKLKTNDKQMKTMTFASKIEKPFKKYMKLCM